MTEEFTHIDPDNPEPETEKEQCKNCKYYIEIHSDKDKMFGEDEIDFECRRYAPRKLHGVGTGYDGQQFANTVPDSWCGEFATIKAETALSDDDIGI